MGPSMRCGWLVNDVMTPFRPCDWLINAVMTPSRPRDWLINDVMTPSRPRDWLINAAMASFISARLALVLHTINPPFCFRRSSHHFVCNDQPAILFSTIKPPFCFQRSTRHFQSSTPSKLQACVPTLNSISCQTAMGQSTRSFQGLGVNNQNVSSSPAAASRPAPLTTC